MYIADEARHSYYLPFVQKMIDSFEVIVDSTVDSDGFLSSSLSTKDYDKKEEDASSFSDFNFAAAGDWGCTDDTRDTVNNVTDKSPELVLGDYSYEDTADCWLDIIQPIDNIMKISIGNHDDDQFLTEYMNHFGLTKEYYSFDYQNVHFIALATESGYLDMSKDKAKEQLAFVKSDLEKTSANSNIKWIIPFFHQMMYYNDEDGGLIEPHDENLRKVYHQLFEKYGVNLILQAHSHTYQRTYPLKVNEDSKDDPIIKNKDLNNYHITDGIVIVTVGTGGAYPTGMNGDLEYTPIQYKDLFGFLNVYVSSDGTRLVGTFYENHHSGEIKDKFTITRSEELATAKDEYDD
jgi:Calcineurin-like phosphoesterase